MRTGELVGVVEDALLLERVLRRHVGRRLRRQSYQRLLFFEHGLVRQQHPDLTPTVEKQRDGPDPY